MDDGKKFADLSREEQEAIAKQVLGEKKPAPVAAVANQTGPKGAIR